MAAQTKIRIAVLYGGRSSEHDVSIMSATNVLAALDPAKYDIVPVYITREGRWLEGAFSEGKPATPADGAEIVLIPGGKGRMLLLPSHGAPHEIAQVDCVFPVLHGLGGEDGAIQGMAETALVPLVGCGLLGSANALDKEIAKRLMKEAGVPVARSATIHRGAAPDFAVMEAELGLPLFIKPARQGSSVGVSKVSAANSYADALEVGFSHDSKLLAEEFIAGREIEFAVLETPEGELIVSRPGEIAPTESHGFYTYDAKYIDADGAALMIPANIPAETEAAMQAVAARAFRAVGCDAMALVDFFLMADGRYLVNEINTIPGFTNISMYPKAMGASGISYPDLIDRLVAHGLARGAAG